MWNDRFGGVVCFHFYYNVTVCIQLVVCDSTASEALNVLIAPVLCFMPKSKFSIEGVESRNCMLVEKATEFHWKKLKAHFPFQCNTKNWLKIPNQNVASGPIKNMQSWEAGEVNSILSRDVSQMFMCRNLWGVEGKPVFPHYPWCARRCVWVWCERTWVIKN